MSDLLKKLKQDISAHPLDRDPVVVAEAIEEIEHLQARVKELESGIRAHQIHTIEDRESCGEFSSEQDVNLWELIK